MEVSNYTKEGSHKDGGDRMKKAILTSILRENLLDLYETVERTQNTLEALVELDNDYYDSRPRTAIIATALSDIQHNLLELNL